MGEFELIERSRFGDTEAFSALVRPHLVMAFRTAVLITHDKVSAEDAVQDALVEVFRHLHRFDHTRNTSFRAWLYRIVVFRAMNAARRQRHYEPLADVPNPELSPADVVIAKEERERLWSVIQEMSPDHRAVIALHYYQDFSVDEIANILRVRPGTVKSRLYHARQQIARKMQENVRDNANA